MYYKLRETCVTNWGSFVLLEIRANVSLLQIRASVVTI